ncbi:MAG: RNA polymerase sigma factor [Steroidobacter sp.]
MNLTSASLEDVRRQIVALLPRMRRFGRTITRHASDADDLVQISIERALLRYQQWRPEAPFHSWVFGIMRNAWIDEIRARGRHGEVIALDGTGFDIADRASEAQLRMLSVQRAMATLPDEQRLAVALVLVEGLSYKEAAEALEIPIGTLTSRLARGREALQKQLE